MELIAYVVMAVGSGIALVARRPRVVGCWFVLFVLYSLVARLSPETTWDMGLYYTSAETGPPPLGLYWLREPIVWFGSSFLYQLTGSRVVTFILIDIASALVVIHAMRKFDDGDNRMLSFAPTIISSYVLLLGQQNVFRQHVAFAILLWALAARARGQRTAVGLYVLSILAHNSTALLFGYWLDVRPGSRRQYGPLITLVGVILMWILFPVLRKSYSATGLNTEYLYVALVGTIGLIVTYANLGRISGIHMAALLNFIGFVPAIVILGSAQFERVAMMFLVVILTDLYRHHRALRLRGVEIATLAYGILVIPVFLFPSALVMLS